MKEDVLFQLKIRGVTEKFKIQPRPLRPRSVNLRQHFRNLSRKTVPLTLINRSVGVMDGHNKGTTARLVCINWEKYMY
jgi:hypothetical protein